MDDELFIGNNCLIDTSKINNKNIFTINKSIPLNPFLADTFYRAGFIEHWGRGIKRICDECKDSGMKMPRFEIVSTDFAIILRLIINMITATQMIRVVLPRKLPR